VYFLAASSDGQRVLFESDEPLGPDDSDGGALDVYERVDGQTRLITTSALHPNAPIDARFSSPGGTSADGRHVLFESDERFLPQDTDSCHRYTDAPDGCIDIYERVGDELRLVTTGPGAVNGNYESGSFLGMSANGARIVFDTSEPLVGEDRDSCGGAYGPLGCGDIYERRDGKTTSLVSTGPTDDQSNCGEDEGLPTRCPGFVGMSRDGKRIYFTTSQSLVPGDADGGLNDIYVSRVLPPGCSDKAKGKAPKKCAG
jgi:hypothetical protein